MNREELIVATKAAGKAAFERGAKCVPALDPAVMPLIKACDNDRKAVIAMLDAWIASWMKANLSTPIEGWTNEENEALRRARAGG